MRSNKTVNLFGTFATAVLLAAAGTAMARDVQGPRAASKARVSQPHTRTVERQRTETGRTRRDTVTRTDGSTATRNLNVSRDHDAGTIARQSNYTTIDGREGSKSDVIQRTKDGFARDTVRIAPDGRTHTRAVEVACDKDADKCVKQVEVGQKP